MNHIKIFVSDIPKKYANRTFLSSFFNKYGGVVTNEIQIFQNTNQNTNESKDEYSAFIAFQTMEYAQTARKHLNYSKLDDHQIHITLADEETNKIRISGRGFIEITSFDQSTDPSQLYQLLSKYGDVIYCKIFNSYITKCYAQFREVQSAKKALQDLKGTQFNGKNIFVYKNRCIYQNSNEFITVCYIVNIPKYITTDDDLKHLFSEFGEVIYSKVPISFGKNKGYGFCMMKTIEEAERAINGLNEKVIDGNVIQCHHYMSKIERSNYLKEKEIEYKKEMKMKNENRSFSFKILDRGVSYDAMKFVFNEIGEIEYFRYSYPCGKVCFRNIEDAQRCIEISPFIFVNMKQVSIFLDYKDEDEYEYVAKKSETQKQKFLTMIREKKNDNERIMSCAKVLSNLQAKCLLDNPHFFVQWIEKANLY